MKGLPLALFCMLLALPAAAGEAGNCYHLASDFDGQIDQAGARAAVKRGDVEPFEKILGKARGAAHGAILQLMIDAHRIWSLGDE